MRKLLVGWMPLLPEVDMPPLTGDDIFEVVQCETAAAGCLDGWGWTELKSLPVPWFDGLAPILAKVEELGVWPEGLLDAYIAMIPKVGGDSTPLGQRPLSVLPVVCRIWASARMKQLEAGFSLGFPVLFIVLVMVGALWRLGILLLLILKRSLLVLLILMFISLLLTLLSLSIRLIEVFWIGFWAVLACLPGSVMLILSIILMFVFVLSLLLALVNLGLGMVVALYLPWCRYLGAECGVSSQLYADILKCVSRDPGLLLRAAGFAAGYVRLVGQEPAPSKCVLLSTSKAVLVEMRGWVLSDEGHRWTVKLDVRDLGGHLDTTLRGWSSTLSLRVRLVISRLDLIFALPLDFYGRVRIVRAMFLPCALHGVEASHLSKGVFFEVACYRFACCLVSKAAAC